MRFSHRLPLYCSKLYTQNDDPILYLHHHDCVEIGYCHSGTGVFVIGSKIIPFTQGDIVIIAPGELHLAQSSKGTESVWTWIYCDPAAIVAPLTIDPALADFSVYCGNHFNNRISAEESRETTQIIYTITRECAGRKLRYEDTVRGLFLALCALVQRLRKPSKQADKHAPLRARIFPAIELIQKEYAEAVSLEAMARCCYMSVTNFRRIFTRAMGRSPQEYLLAFRISLAANDLKNSGQSISRIALTSGFTTLSAFNRKFKQTMKMTPREYRKNRN